MSLGQEVSRRWRLTGGERMRIFLTCPNEQQTEWYDFEVCSLYPPSTRDSGSRGQLVLGKADCGAGTRIKAGKCDTCGQKSST